MSADDLFPDAILPSPRLRWLERHGLVLAKQENGKWLLAMDDENWAEGSEAEEAIVRFCVEHCVRHYSQE